MYQAQSLDRLRKETFAAYGGACACCGESTLQFLAIDHVNGGGNRERKNLGRFGVSFYRLLRQQGYPQGDYQVLCHNCNCAKGFYGECPHEAARLIAPTTSASAQ